MVLNKTNSKTITYNLETTPTTRAGQAIQLYSESGPLPGQDHDGLRCGPPVAKKNSTTNPVLAMSLKGAAERSGVTSTGDGLMSRPGHAPETDPFASGWIATSSTSTVSQIMIGQGARTTCGRG